MVETCVALHVLQCERQRLKMLLPFWGERAITCPSPPFFPMVAAKRFPEKKKKEERKPQLNKG